MSRATKSLDFPKFSVCHAYGWRIEERVQVYIAGDIRTAPTLRVTDEHRARWSDAYKAFRRELSWWTSFRLFVQEMTDRRNVSLPNDPALDVHFHEYVERARAGYKPHDGMISDDIYIAMAECEPAEPNQLN